MVKTTTKIYKPGGKKYKQFRSMTTTTTPMDGYYGGCDYGYPTIQKDHKWWVLFWILLVFLIIWIAVV